jgi:hypothetical protein
MGKKNKILVISYYACIPGACQAEWVDDKVDSFIKAGDEVALVSATCGRRHENSNIKHWRIPSLSFTDYRDEIRRSSNLGDDLQLRHLILLPLVLTLGVLTDLLQHLLTKGVGDGRWSWTFPSCVGAYILALSFKPNIVLTTGGPASAHLAGIVIGKLISSPVIVELQDPLSGGDIGRNAQSRVWLYWVEKLIVRMADKIVYVTRAAADFARNQFRSDKVFGIYPGARDFMITVEPRLPEATMKLRLVHLGSLYATRTFKSIIAAIDALIHSGKIESNEIELINLGHVSKEISDEILQKSYVRILPPISRENALRYAAQCDITLLIQNSDERSKVTIPYKTYDYLNLDNKLLALLNSDELSDMIRGCGQIAVPLSDVDEIKNQLVYILENKAIKRKSLDTIDAVQQSRELLELNIKSK